MPPGTRSRGIPPPSSRIYNATPSLQQVQFPSRRKRVRLPRPRDGEGDRGGDDQDDGSLSPTSALTLKQQTLTQLDFVQSSFEDEGWEGPDLEDSEKEEMQKGDSKENVRPGKKKVRVKQQEEEEEESDDQPVSSRRRKRKTGAARGLGEKRRRTLGDGQGNPLKAHLDDDWDKDRNDRKSSRRKTLGDEPASSSKYHTQTLTQFMGRDGFHPLLVLDSDDEVTDNDKSNINEDHDFDAWLGEDVNPIPPSSRPTLPPRAASGPAARQDSVVPQTPTKPIRTEIPSSSQQVTPLSGMMLERYGAPNVMQASPSSAAAGRRVKSVDAVYAGPTPVSRIPVARRQLVVEDSFASEGIVGTPSKSLTNLEPDYVSGEAVNHGDGEQVEVASSTPGDTPSGPRWKPGSPNTRKASSPKRVRISSASPVRSSPKQVAVADGRDEIPDSEDEDAIYQDEDEDGEDFAAGEDTQLALNQLGVAEPQEDQGQASETTAISSSPPLRRSQPGHQQTAFAVADTNQARPRAPSSRPPKRLRKPLPAPAAPTQPFESQRLPTALVQSFTPADFQTDAIIPLSPAELALVTGGYQVSVTLPFRLIDSVVRFWFWDGTRIQYGAALDEDGKQRARRNGALSTWEYNLPQVYELNDPLGEDELKLEDFSCRNITRYGYMPRSIASGMLWNLGRALFADEHSAEEELAIIAEDETECEHEDGPGHRNDEARAAAPQRRLFSRGRTPGSVNSAGMTVSQEVEAQLQSDIAHSTQFVPSDEILVPSTPEDHEPTPRRVLPPPSPREPLATGIATNAVVRPSQATTASQCSTPSPTKSLSAVNIHSTPRAPNFTQQDLDKINGDGDEDAEGGVIANDIESSSHHHHLLPIPCSSSLTFQDYSAPSPLAPHLLMMQQQHAAAGGLDAPSSSSQLLSKSQMLPDSLVRDESVGAAYRDVVDE